MFRDHEAAQEILFGQQNSQKNQNVPNPDVHGRRRLHVWPSTGIVDDEGVGEHRHAMGVRVEYVDTQLSREPKNRL